MTILSTHIQLDKMRFYAHHGVLPQETRVGAYFVVSLDLEVDFQQAMETDDLAHTVNYAAVYEAVKEVMEVPSKLLEHVAGRILQRLYDDFPEIRTITLQLDKENPPMGAQCKSCGVHVKSCR